MTLILRLSLHLFSFQALLLIAMNKSTSNAQSIDSCPSGYYFLTEPLPEFPCNPYSNSNHSDLLVLECNVLGPPDSINNERAFTIEWYRTLAGNGVTQNLNILAETQMNLVNVDTEIILNSFHKNKIVRSKLKVKNISKSTVVGDYWCAVILDPPTLNGDELIAEGTHTTLERLGSIEYQNLMPCPQDRIIHTSLSGSCVNFEGMASTGGSTVSTPDSGMTTSSSGSSTNISQVTTGSQDTERSKDIVISVMIVIIVSTIGGTLVVMVLVLLLIVVCLCCRKPNNHKAINMEKVYPVNQPITSSTTLISSPPKPATKPMNPPQYPPPVPRKPQTLPPKLTHEILPSPPSDGEEYAPVEPSRINGKRAATINGGCHSTCIISSTTSTGSGHSSDIKYKSLNREMMNERRLYEAPSSFEDEHKDIDEVKAICISSIDKDDSISEDQKYKSLNRDMMDSVQVYKDPNVVNKTIESDENATVGTKDKSNGPKNPKHFRMNRQRYLDLSNLQVLPQKDTRVSIDGEYVEPNGMIDAKYRLSSQGNMELNEVAEYMDLA